MTKISKIIATGFGATMLLAAGSAFAAAPQAACQPSGGGNEAGYQSNGGPASCFGDCSSIQRQTSGFGAASRFGNGREETNTGNGPASRFGSGGNNSGNDPFEETIEVHDGDKPAGRYGFGERSASAADYDSQDGAVLRAGHGSDDSYNGQNSYNRRGSFNGQSGGNDSQYRGNSRYGGGRDGCSVHDQSADSETDSDADNERHSYNGNHRRSGSGMVEESSDSLIFEIYDKTECETDDCARLTLRDANGHRIEVGAVEFEQELIDDSSLEELIYHLAQNGSAVKGRLELGEADDEGVRLYTLHVEQIYS